MHIEAPASDQWAAVGMGNAMDGSLMFIMSPSGDGDGKVIPTLFMTGLISTEVVLSVRSAHGHDEPKEINANVEILSLGIYDGVMQAKAKWKLHDSRHFSKVDVALTKQPWIWVVRPSKGKDSDTIEGKRSRSLENELEQYSSYGKLRKR